jgi:hypothetical protein
MLTKEDLIQIKAKGIDEEQIKEQLASFARGFPFLEITDSASVEKGIRVVPQDKQLIYIDAWEEYSAKNKTIVKFVPASGAASRMFKDLFAFLEADYQAPRTPSERQFFDEIEKFAFHEELNTFCRNHYKKDIPALTKAGRYKDIALALLNEPGLNYGQLPKGLLLFHTYPKSKRTAMEEHLAEGSMYAKNDAGDVRLHFTVSAEHEKLFRAFVKKKKEAYENRFSVEYHISFSRQKPATDTIAADINNEPFRDTDGKLVFRPGGHGSLIQNLNDIDADIIFIKNIDNVVPDGFKYSTVICKKVLAGILIKLQAKIYEYLRLIDSGKYTHKQVEEMIRFLQNELCTRNPDMKYLEDSVLVLYLKRKFHRPVRVCGMVKNTGEPGGGPFFALNRDGTISPQISESSQIDLNNPEKKKLFEKGTHFNPVDLVCAVKDHNGNKYNLPDYTDDETGFISVKSKNGKELKALELPGLWNGAMSDWNTVFVEVPAETFSPVKTVNDLLRPEHQ